MKNPFTLTFGQQPELLIQRYKTSERIISDFMSEHVVSQTYVLTGIRGSGKTVLMSSIYKSLEKQKNWIVVDLNSSSNSMIDDFVSELIAKSELKSISVDFKIDLPIGVGVGVSLKKEGRELTNQVKLEKIFQKLKSKEIRVLVTIDECINNKQMQEFAGLYQLLIRHDNLIYLVMTGLYKNIEELSNNKNLTFLYRAERIYLDNLDLALVNQKYNSIFNDKELSSKMAKLTKGYPYAFQTLGYLVFEEKTHNLDNVLEEYQSRLIDYVYRKIFSECTKVEKEILKAIVSVNNPTTTVIANTLNRENNFISNYKKELEKKGILEKTYGEFVFALPEFDNYIRNLVD